MSESISFHRLARRGPSWLSVFVLFVSFRLLAVSLAESQSGADEFAPGGSTTVSSSLRPEQRGHNFDLDLHPVTWKLHFLPWDLDRAFSHFGKSSQSMDLNLTRPYGGTCRLTDRLLAAPQIGDRYQMLQKVLAAGPLAKERLLKELARLEKVSKLLRERDAEAAAKRQDGGGPAGGMSGSPPELPTFIQTRTESVAAHLAGTSKGFVPPAFGPFGGFGPPGGSGPPGGFAMGARAGEIFSVPQQDQSKLTDEQKKRLAEIQKETDACIEVRLSEEQRQILTRLRNPSPPGPGGVRPPRGGRGPQGRTGRSGPQAVQPSELGPTPSTLSLLPGVPGDGADSQQEGPR